MTETEGRAGGLDIVAAWAAISQALAAMAKLRRSERARQIGKIGGLATVVRHGPDAIAARAREGLWARFVREGDPTGTLPEAERIRRAYLVQRAHYARIAVKSVNARRRKAAVT